MEVLEVVTLVIQVVIVTVFILLVVQEEMVGQVSKLNATSYSTITVL